MPKLTAADVTIDHVHCRAICDEIGERLRYALKREAPEIPQNLLVLINKLDELDGAPIVLAPSIVPSLEEMLFDVTSHSKRLLRAK